MKTENEFEVCYTLPDENGETQKLVLNEEDSAKVIRGKRWTATVVDQETGKSFKIRSASCGLPYCLCAIALVKDRYQK